MPEGFVNIEVESDPEVLRQEIYDLIQQQFPEWDPAKAALDKWMVDGCSLIAGDLADVVIEVPKEIMQQFGLTLFEIPPLGAEPAVATINILIQDNIGYPTIPAGTQMMFIKPDGNKVAFRTKEAVEVPVGVTKIEGVEIEAVEPGPEANQISDDPELLDSVSYVTALEQTSENTKGGLDAETPDEYLDRLSTELELLTIAPIVPQDFEKLARRFGMYRAVAIDGYNPGDESDENERMIAVAMVDEEGEEATAEKKEEYKAEVELLREVNFVINMMDPTYTPINVDVEVVALPGFDIASVKAIVEEVLGNYFASKNWANTAADPRMWRQNTVVRHSELVWLINTVPGVDYIVDPLKLSKEEAETKAEDVALEGKAALTKPGTFNVTVKEPV